MKMYVANLSFQISEEDVKNLFSAYGDVSSVKIITDRDTNRSRGFGFVEMDVTEEAEAAMKGLNNKEVEGRALAVTVAREKEARNDGKRW